MPFFSVTGRLRASCPRCPDLKHSLPVDRIYRRMDRGAYSTSPDIRSEKSQQTILHLFIGRYVSRLIEWRKIDEDGVRPLFGLPPGIKNPVSFRISLMEPLNVHCTPSKEGHGIGLRRPTLLANYTLGPDTRMVPRTMRRKDLLRRTRGSPLDRFQWATSVHLLGAIHRLIHEMYPAIVGVQPIELSPVNGVVLSLLGFHTVPASK